MKDEFCFQRREPHSLAVPTWGLDGLRSVVMEMPAYIF